MAVHPPVRLRQLIVFEHIRGHWFAIMCPCGAVMFYASLKNDVWRYVRNYPVKLYWNFWSASKERKYFSQSISYSIIHSVSVFIWMIHWTLQVNCPARLHSYWGHSWSNGLSGIRRHAWVQRRWLRLWTENCFSFFFLLIWGICQKAYVVKKICPAWCKHWSLERPSSAKRVLHLPSSSWSG